MSDRDNWKINTQRMMIFEIFDPVTLLPKPGVDPVSLDITLLLNAGVPGTPPAVTVTEIANGRYLARYTPNTLGFWYLSIRDSVNNAQGWVDEIDCISFAPNDFVTANSVVLSAIATAVLTFPITSLEVSARGVRCLVAVVQRIRNKVSRTNPTTFTVYETGGTAAWSTTVATDNTQLPVVSETPTT